MNEAAKRTTVEVKLDELIVDLDTGQRALDQGRVNRLAADFQADALGVLTISLRPDGSRAIIDGQHRQTAALQVGYDRAVTAVQYEGLSPADEAVMFLHLNNTKQVQPIDKFRARIIAGEVKATAIKRVLDEHGWIVRISQEDWSLTAISAAEKVYDGMGVVQGDDATLLHNVMTVISSAWNGQATSANGALLTAMGKFLGWYGTDVDYEKMTRDLAGVKPRNLLADFRTLKDIQRVDMSNAGARVLQGIHDSGRRTATRLPEWVNR